jgi:hypothetical protein
LQYNEKMSRINAFDISNKAKKYLDDPSTEGIVKFLNNFLIEKNNSNNKLILGKIFSLNQTNKHN